jgi:hypothetical protein
MHLQFYRDQVINSGALRFGCLCSNSSSGFYFVIASLSLNSPASFAYLSKMGIIELISGGLL